MIELKLLLVVLFPHGPLEKADFERLAQEIDPFIVAKKLTGLTICAKAFPGWDNFGTLVSHLRFVRDHHRHVERIAAVTDSEFLKIVPSHCKALCLSTGSAISFRSKDRGSGMAGNRRHHR